MRLLANNVYCYNNLELHCHTWDMLQYSSCGYCTFRRFTELQVPYSVGPENNYFLLWWDFLVEPPIQQTFWNFFPIEVNKFLSKLWLLHARPPSPPPTEFSKTLHIIMMVWIFSGTQHFKQQLFTYYAAESFSWNSLDLEKQFCTPESFHNLFIIDTSSGVNFTSSILPASANSSRASSWKRHMWNEKKPTNNCKDCWKKARIARPHNAFSYDTIQIVIQGPWI